MRSGFGPSTSRQTEQLLSGRGGQTSFTMQVRFLLTSWARMHTWMSVAPKNMLLNKNKRFKQILCFCLCWSTHTTPTTAPPPIAPQQHPSHGQHFHLHLAALGETEVQQRTDHQLHGALQPGRHHQRLLGVLSHQVSKTKIYHVYNV